MQPWLISDPYQLPSQKSLDRSTGKKIANLADNLAELFRFQSEFAILFFGWAKATGPLSGRCLLIIRGEVGHENALADPFTLFNMIIG